MSDKLFKKNQKLLRSYKKQQRNERPKVLIVCEDSKSSVIYFKQFCKAHRIDAKVYITGDCGSAPKSVVEHAIEICEEKTANYDEAFCIIDRDNHPKFDEIIDKTKNWRSKKETKLRTIVSYPCFEIWLILHFSYTTKPYENCDSLINDLNIQLTKSGLSLYAKNDNINYEAFIQRTETALINARKLTEHLKQTGSKNPSTEIHILIELLHKIKERNY